MTTESFQNDLEKIRNKVKDFQEEWLESLDNFKEMKDEVKENDLFSKIDYLTFCDQLRKIIFMDLNEIDKDLKFLKKVEKSKHQLIASFDTLFGDLHGLKTSMQKKMQALEEEYPILSEETLREAQDVISKFSTLLQQEKSGTSLRGQLNQNLDKESFIKELRDSLETYREAREEFVSEINMEYLQSLEHVPEDIGEEDPELDPIISQLDTAISECDMALLMNDISS